VLAFLTGREEVDTVVQLLAEQSQERGLRGEGCHCKVVVSVTVWLFLSL